MIINITEEYNGLMHFAGVCDMQSTKVKIAAKYNGSVYECEVAGSSKTFDLYIPFSGSGNIDFFVQQDNGELLPACVSFAFPARINDLPYSFFVGDKTLITRIEKEGMLHVEALEYERLCHAVRSYVNVSFFDE